MRTVGWGYGEMFKSLTPADASGVSGGSETRPPSGGIAHGLPKNTSVSELNFYTDIGKRNFDVILSALMILAISPVLVVIAASLRVNGVRSVVYKHRRIGQGGRSFDCLKFRTMVEGADETLEKILAADATAREEWDLSHKLTNDPRIIPGMGRLLRTTSLDELPQLLNVLRGDMSIVGPRPITSEELGKYGSHVGYYLSVRPGLTGPWQIGGRSDTSFDYRVQKDVWYAQNICLRTDLGVFIKTIACFLSGRLTGAR